jgi:hypothetical protein
LFLSLATAQTAKVKRSTVLQKSAASNGTRITTLPPARVMLVSSRKRNGFLDKKAEGGGKGWGTATNVEILNAGNSEEEPASGDMVSARLAAQNVAFSKKRSNAYLDSRSMFSSAALLASVLLIGSSGSSPPCTCRPDIPADGVGGSCSITRDDSKWCQIRFTGTARLRSEEPEVVQNLLQRLKQGGEEREVALTGLGSVHPERWDRDFVLGFVPAMLEDALSRNAPERLPEITDDLSKLLPDMLPRLQSKTTQAAEFKLGRYKTFVSYGCIDFTSENFSAMVKSRFSNAPQRCQWK